MGQAESAAFARHGGRIDDARRLYPAAPGPWLDLSTGINPVAWRPRVPVAFDPAPLPSVTALAQLETTAAAFFGASPDRVAAVPGSEIALRLLPALGLPAPVIALRPCYGTHGAVAAEQVATCSLDDVAGRAATILLANPNNPDGRLLPLAELLRIADRQRAANGWLVVDEAFADATPDASVLPHLDRDAPVVVLRSFGKFFGLAGLRLGFVVAPRAVIERVRAWLGDWPVATQAIAWGQAAYADRDWIAETRHRLTQTARRLDTLLARHRLAATGASPLFRLVEHADAPAIFDRLAHVGILTRPFADRPDWLRFGLPGSDTAFDRLDRALSHG